MTMLEHVKGKGWREEASADEDGRKPAHWAKKVGYSLGRPAT